MYSLEFYISLYIWRVLFCLSLKGYRGLGMSLFFFHALFSSPLPSSEMVVTVTVTLRVWQDCADQWHTPAFAEAHQKSIILTLNAANQGANLLFSVAIFLLFFIIIIFLMYYFKILFIKKNAVRIVSRYLKTNKQTSFKIPFSDTCKLYVRAGTRCTFSD